MFVQSVIDIAAPPEAAWPVMVDVARWPEWTPTMTSLEVIGGGPLTVGARVRVRQPKLPVAIWRVTHLEDGEAFAWESRAPGVTVTAWHRLEAVGGATRCTLEVNAAGPLAWLMEWFTGKITREYVATEAAGLKRRVEAGRAS